MTIIPAVSAFCSVIWNTPVTVDFQLDSLETPNVAINDADQIIAIWNFEGSNEDHVSHATWQGQTWTSSFALANQSNSQWFSMVHVDAQGRGVALVPDGSNPVYQATYDGTAGDPEAPLQVSMNNSELGELAWGTHEVPAVDWNRAIQKTVVGHQLLKDGVLIANLSGSASSYIGRGRVKGQRVVYTLVASNGDGFTTSSTITVN
ncbi:hypothetical protein [Candidatus Neptunichlamydia sp. REUL1]|uniref:hypothetical protein n=1 Tax=Candidatus Neptunichlamydia sp. REUL1 TaxID=3064277 RepID=UPI002931AC9A|nr:hypothetical protein [Candidatus Neptunochlamydia sp. REUL1]